MRLPLKRPTSRRGNGDAVTATVRARLVELADALCATSDVAGVAGAVGLSAECWWLAHAVLRAELPTADEVLASRRSAALDGPEPVLRDLLADARRAAQAEPGVTVRVATEETVVDVHHTARTEFFTGIQRVVMETVRRWASDHRCLLVGWNDSMTRLEVLDRSANRRLGGDPATMWEPATVVVPWRGAFLVPELAADPPRTMRLLALFRHSSCRTGMIGYDCVPLTTAETCGPGMPGAFARMLAAASGCDVVVPISEAAAGEYRGWRAMLHGSGRPGPEVVAVTLPVVPPPGEPDEPVDVELLRWPGKHLVLVVGSHEPRKNHLAILAAAEQLWQEGLRFHVVFIGGNAWNSQRFESELGRLRADGHPVTSVRAVSDALLAAAYREARTLVFPSLNEGFGLPAAEALAVGTPVVLSRHGSLAEIAEGGGTVTVDPRDDDDLARGIRAVLTDDALHRRLSEEAAARPHSSWEEYATRTWSALTGG